MAITDLAGTLEPCGCTSAPLGGIDRMAAQLERLRDGTPTLFVAAGDLFFGGAHTDLGAGAEVQERFKAELLADLLGDLQLLGASGGANDLTQGPEVLRSLAQQAAFPLLVGPLPSPGQEGAASAKAAGPLLVVEAGQVRVGFFAVGELPADLLSPAVAEAERDDRALPATAPPGVTPLTPEATSARAAAALRARGAEVVVALVGSGRRAARAVARTAGVHFVIRGGLDMDEPAPPERVGDATLFHAGRHGQGLLVVDLYGAAAGAFADWSDWTVDAARTQLAAQLADLDARLGSIGEKGAAQSRDGERLRERRAALLARRDALVVSPGLSGNRFNARFLPLSQALPRAPAVSAAMAGYDQRVNAYNAERFRDLVPEPAPPGLASYLGSGACASCHQGAFSWWQSHAHGRAYGTLATRDKQFNLSCVGCHVTGYLKPGGATVTHLQGGALENVGCESCHGPGSAHVRAAGQGHIARAVAEATCVGCHNPEHSDRFSYAPYRRSLLVPGHGLPSARGRGALGAGPAP